MGSEVGGVESKKVRRTASDEGEKSSSRHATGGELHADERRSDPDEEDCGEKVSHRAGSAQLLVDGLDDEGRGGRRFQIRDGEEEGKVVEEREDEGGAGEGNHLVGSKEGDRSQCQA